MKKNFLEISAYPKQKDKLKVSTASWKWGSTLLIKDKKDSLKEARRWVKTHKNSNISKFYVASDLFGKYSTTDKTEMIDFLSKKLEEMKIPHKELLKEIAEIENSIFQKEQEKRCTAQLSKRISLTHEIKKDEEHLQDIIKQLPELTLTIMKDNYVKNKKFKVLEELHKEEIMFRGHKVILKVCLTVGRKETCGLVFLGRDLKKGKFLSVGLPVDDRPLSCYGCKTREEQEENIKQMAKEVSHSLKKWEQTLVMLPGTTLEERELFFEFLCAIERFGTEEKVAAQAFLKSGTTDYMKNYVEEYQYEKELERFINPKT